MSYSLQARGTTKALALQALAAAFDNAVGSQLHSRDKVSAMAAATAATDSLADDGNRDVMVNVNGNLSWDGVLAQGESPAFTACHVAANAYLTPRA